MTDTTEPTRPARWTPWLWPPVVVVVLAVASWLDVSNWLTGVAAVAGAVTVRAWWRRRFRQRDSAP